MKNTSFVTRSKDVSLAEAGRSKMQMMIEDMKLGKFFVCQYDNDWYFLVVNYLSSEHGDVNMIFLHPKGPSEKVSWPQCDSTCWIPIEDVNCKVDAPSMGSTERFCFNKKKQCKKLKTISIKTSSSIVHY